MDVASRYAASEETSAGNPCGETKGGDQEASEGGMGRRARPPADSQGTKSPLTSPGLHPGPAARRDQAEAREGEGPGLEAGLEAVSFFFPLEQPQECPKLGAGKPASAVASALQ